jgi:hypothetical protein
MEVRSVTRAVLFLCFVVAFVTQEVMVMAQQLIIPARRFLDQFVQLTSIPVAHWTQNVKELFMILTKVIGYMKVLISAHVS